MSFNFERLSVYQKAIELTNDIYNLTKKWPKEYLYDITSQLRRAVLSISLNIAEGSSRTTKGNKNFLDISRGSRFEAIAIITVAKKQRLLTANQYDSLYLRLTELSKMLSGLKSSLK